MTQMFVRHVRLIGMRGESTFEFRKRVTVITGPVASGKTSMLEMIKHGLGGDAVVTKAVRRSVRYVELLIRIREERFLLERAIGSGSDVIAITSADGEGQPIGERQLLPLHSNDDGTTVSSFLMRRLGIPQLRFPRSSRDPDEDLTTVTFNDVYGLMYLDQDQIDGAIGYDGARHSKWRLTFEVIYGLADAEIATLRTRLGQANADHSRVASYVREVERFLEAVGSDDAPSGAPSERECLQRKLAQLDDRLLQLRERTRAIEMTSLSRSEIVRAEREVEEARTTLARHLAERDSLQRVRAQLRSDLQQVRRALSATEVLRELEFESCPRCLQAVPEHRESDHCRLCDQPEPEATPNLNAEIELRRLTRQLAETDELIAAGDADSDRRSAALTRSEAALSTARAEWDAQSRQQVSPFLDQMAALAEQRGAVTNALAERDRVERQSRELSDARTEADRLRGEQRRLARELETAQARLEQGRETLAALSQAYADIITSVDMPWSKSASIHPRSFVPLVDGDPVRLLSSGGLKTIANFGFYLAQLQITLRGYPTRLPSFMVIDSPRKNFVSNDADAESMRRFYRTLWTLTAQRTGTNFQVIVADNDSPSEERDQFELLRLDRAHPLVDAAGLQGTREGEGHS